MLSTWLAEWQADNPERFNLDFVHQRRNTYESDLESILDDVCSTLADAVEHIEYNGMTLFTDEAHVRGLAEEDFKNIEDNRLVLALFRFTLSADDGEETLLLRVLFPKLVDDFFFTLNDNRYVAVYQMIDRGTYTTEKSLVLKTLLMPVVYRHEKETFAAESGGSWTGDAVKLDIFKKSLNVFHWITAKYGIPGALDFFGWAGSVRSLGEDGEPEAGSEVFRFARDRRFAVSGSLLGEDGTAPAALATFLSWLKSSRVENFDGQGTAEACVVRLGRSFTADKTRMEEKAKGLLRSLERILDKRTRENLSHLDPSDRRDIHHVLRWMLVKHKELWAEDNMDLRNKRLRMAEYLTLPLIRKFSEATYRYFSMRAVSLRQLKSLFGGVGLDFCLKRLRVSRFLKYVASVNAMELFISQKATLSGEAGMGDDSGTNIAVRYRGVHPSFAGRFGLFATSASDPGITSSIVPFVEATNGGWCFDDEIRHRTGQPAMDAASAAEMDAELLAENGGGGA